MARARPLPKKKKTVQQLEDALARKVEAKFRGDRDSELSHIGNVTKELVRTWISPDPKTWVPELSDEHRQQMKNYAQYMKRLHDQEICDAGDAVHACYLCVEGYEECES